MTQSTQAIFEHGVFRPLEPVTLPEHEVVSLAVASLSGNVPSEPADHDKNERERRKSTFRAALQAAARLPVEGPNDGFSGGDHDQVLYGWKK